MDEILVGITGASGAIYAHRLVAHLKNSGAKVSLIASNEGKKVSEYEGQREGFELADKIYRNDDFFAPVASGSYLYKAMVIIPCSMGTLGKISQGIGDNLLCRAADVRIKEQQKLIIVPREMPYSSIHLKNMLSLAEAGVTIMSADPHFYTRPESVEDLVDTVLARVLDHIGVSHNVGKRWGNG